MAQGPGKVSVACPHCNAKQLESAYAKSAFCRKCGRHIDLRSAAVSVPDSDAEEGESGLLGKFSRMFQREKFRDIRCYHCHAPQTVSSFAKSGSCPQCGGYIDLRDYELTGNFSRSIQTQGSVVISKKGDVTSSKIVCYAAVVEGRINAVNLQCTEELRIKTTGRFLGAIESKKLILEKKCDVEFVRPLRVGTAEIFGRVTARIYADLVVVDKGAELEGAVHAKAIRIEKGGVFQGDLFIGKPQLEQAELIAVPEASKSASAAPSATAAAAEAEVAAEETTKVINLSGGRSSSIALRPAS